MEGVCVNIGKSRISSGGLTTTARLRNTADSTLPHHTPRRPTSDLMKTPIIKTYPAWCTPSHKIHTSA